MANVFSLSKEPTAILSSIDFASKGLSKPRIVRYEETTARLTLKAIYEGPKRGWPPLTRESLQEIAGATPSATQKPKFPCCAVESEEVKWPIPVTIIITLLPPGASSETYLQIIKTHTQLYVNDYRPFQLPVAFWRAVEGIWVVLREEGGISLPEWWETRVKPSLERSENRWRIASWRRKSDQDGSELSDGNGAVTPKVKRRSSATMGALDDQSGDSEPSSSRHSDSPTRDDPDVPEGDRGWLPAVEVLIQIADILLSLHERCISVVVSRPEFYSVVPDRPFTPRSIFPMEPQEMTLELTTVIAAVPTAGYGEGQLFKRRHIRGQDTLKTAESEDGRARQRENISSAPTAFLEEQDDGLIEKLGQDGILRHMRFIAPEAIISKRNVEPVVDVFAWAATAAQLIGSGRLRDGNDLSDDDENIPPEFYSAVHAHSTQTPPDLSSLRVSIPPELSAIVRKARSLDPEDRYQTMSALLYDLHKVKDICNGKLRGKERENFCVGHVDDRSRFKIPPGMLDRQEEYAELDKSFELVSTTGTTQVACCWGLSGTGKSQLLETWVKARESEMQADREVLVGWAKMDRRLLRPFSGFISIFCSLLERVFSDPMESASSWRRRILRCLPSNADIFLSLLPKEWRVTLLGDQESTDSGQDTTVGIDWENWARQFRTWSYGLLRLFASAERQLIIVIDDYQWLGKSERELWSDLVSSPARRIDHCFILVSYLTSDVRPPDMGAMAPVRMIQARPFSTDTLKEMIAKGFHLEELYTELPNHWNRLAEMVHRQTQGIPFDCNWALLKMVTREGTIYYDHARQTWEVSPEALVSDREGYSQESFCPTSLDSLSSAARLLLYYLACLPSRGVELSLLERLTHRNEATVKSLIQECSSLGSIVLVDQHVQFVHDKLHMAAMEMIEPEERPRLLVTIARELKGLSTEYDYLQADMYLNAHELDPQSVPSREVVPPAVKAARKAAVSGAVETAKSYLDRAATIWPYEDPWTWREDPDLTFDLVKAAGEISLCSQSVSEHTERASIDLALQQVSSVNTKLEILTWLFRLKQRDAGPQPALQVFYAALDLLGYSTASKDSGSTPSTQEDILSLVDAPTPLLNAEGLTAMRLADLMGFIGLATYSHMSVDERFRIFNFVIPVILHNHAATKHSSTAYIWYLYAILLGGNDISRLDSVKAWLKVAEKTPRPNGGPMDAVMETCRAVAEHYSASSLRAIDYSHAHQLWLATPTSNPGIRIRILSLDLATQTLSGFKIGDMLQKGKGTLAALADYMQPSRSLQVPFLQFAANLADAKLWEALAGDVARLRVLEGAFVVPSEFENRSDAPPVDTLSYGIASLFLGILFKAPAVEIARRAKLIYHHQASGTGTILQPFYRIVMATAMIISGDPASAQESDTTDSWLAAFSHNRDFSAIRLFLRGLRSIKACAHPSSQPDRWLDSVEVALEHLEDTGSHLLAGLLCLQVEDCLRESKSLARLRRDYLRHARSAFQACGAANLDRFADALSSSVPGFRAGTGPLLRQSSATPSSLSGTNTPSNPGDLLREMDTNSRSSSGKEPEQRGSKLGLEGILRSFLMLASEKDSAGLIRRVLQVLLQVTCTQYACLAIQDPTSGILKLKGYGGAFEDIQVCSKALSDCKSLAPTVVLTHASVSRKPLTETTLRSENASIISREPFFAVSGPPKSLLVLPLSVQGRFSGLLYLSGNVSSSRLLTDQVELLATFAAILLENNQAYATLEAAVEIRTQQLQHALHSRSTFISGVSHELRTPLFAISGLCSVMETSSDLTEGQRENLQVISQSASDLQRIVTDVLDWSKLDAGSITPESIDFDLRGIVENALETVAHLARSKNITLFLENSVSTDQQWPLLGDPHRYRQCLLNLLSNAIKFTKPAVADKPSTVSVSWSWREMPDKVEITCAVKDEGIGIPAKSMHKLFQSFSQVDSGISRTFGGTGLGLSITRGLARVLGGDCWAESLEGQGSTFYLSIMAHKNKNAPDIPVYPKVAPGSFRRAIVYAEKTAPISVLQSNLHTFGLNTRLGTLPPGSAQPWECDFIIIDMDDPRVSSEIILALKQRHSACQFIYLVNLTDVQKFASDLKDDITLTKPIKARSLYNATRAEGAEETKAQKPVKKISALDAKYARLYPLSILYVDDSQINVAVGKKILSKFGYKGVDMCSNGQQAIEAAKKTRYDLMLMDLQMPIMDGHKAKSIIASDPEQYGNPYIVALTANSDQPTRDRCIVDERFQGFLTKPLVISSLAETLQAAHEYKNEREGEDSISSE